MYVDEFSVEEFRAGMIVWSVGIQTDRDLPITAPSIILIKVFES
jgi:hypothetical protein